MRKKANSPGLACKSSVPKNYRFFSKPYFFASRSMPPLQLWWSWKPFLRQLPHGLVPFGPLAASACPLHKKRNTRVSLSIGKIVFGQEAWRVVPSSCSSTFSKNLREFPRPSPLSDKSKFPKASGGTNPPWPIVQRSLVKKLQSIRYE